MNVELVVLTAATTWVAGLVAPVALVLALVCLVLAVVRDGGR